MVPLPCYAARSAFFFCPLYIAWICTCVHVNNFQHTHTHIQYKYQINIDGTVAAYRLPYLLAGGSLILKQDSSYYEHFYHKLEPWVHYVPIKQDISDLLEKVEWAKENDREAEEIAKNAAQFVRDNVLPEHIYCYMVRLLKVIFCKHCTFIIHMCMIVYTCIILHCTYII